MAFSSLYQMGLALKKHFLIINSSSFISKKDDFYYIYIQAGFNQVPVP